MYFVHPLTNISVDLSTDAQRMYWPTYQPILNQYVDRTIGRHSADMSTKMCRSSSGRCVGGQSTDMLVAMSTESGGLIVGRHVDPKATDILPILHCYFCILVTVACRHNLTWVCCLITTKFVAHHQKGSWGNAYNLYIWHWQSKLLSDIPPTVNRYSADKRWLAYRQASLDISTEISADSRLICRPWLGHYLGRYVDRHILVIISDERYVDRHIGHLH